MGLDQKKLDKFMQKHWTGFLSDWQKDQWAEDMDDRLSPSVTEDIVYDFIGNVEENDEVKDFYPLIWNSIDWKKLTNDAIRTALEVYDNIIFANGGDRGNTNTPEYEEFKDNNKVKFVWGVGGNDKKNSSSWILNRWTSK